MRWRATGRPPPRPLPDRPADAGPLPPLREVIARHGLAARRALGQHFLNDLNLTRRIARAAGPLEAGTTVEVGPGPGGLTRALLEAGATVLAIELDRRCVSALAELDAAYPGRLTVIEGDARKLDITALAPAPRRVVANLPYNVATPLIVRWMRDIEAYESLTLMVQKEVAERICALPRTPAYGRLGALVGWRAEARRLFDVDPRAFIPPPRVTSSVVRIVPRAAPLAEAGFAAFERVTAAAFGQRRKMLRSALASLGGDPLALIAAAGVPPTARAEELPIESLCALARAFAARQEEEAQSPSSASRRT
jgi:16S rRNA (adenine1518-N6/adenine1519-N6)-dimethyltransferase